MMSNHETELAGQVQRLAIFIVRTLPPSVWNDYGSLWSKDLRLLDSLAQERREALEGMIDPSPRISEELLNKAFGVTAEPVDEAYECEECRRVLR